MTTTYFLNQVMGNVFHTKESPTLPKKYFIGLSSTEPSIDGTCNGEPSFDGTAYARVELTSLSTPTNGVITNIDTITFPQSLSDWGTMNFYTVYDSATGGNLLFFGELTISRHVEIYTSLVIEPGNLSISIQSAA